MLQPRLKRKYLQDHGLPPDFFEKLAATPSYLGVNSGSSTLPKPRGNGGGGGGNTSSSNRNYYQHKNAPNDQMVDSRHSSRNSSVERKFDSYDRRKSPTNTSNDWSKQNPNFFNRNKREENNERFRDDTSKFWTFQRRPGFFY